MQLLFDFFPLIAFFAAYVIYDLYVATATIMVVDRACRSPTSGFATARSTRCC